MDFSGSCETGEAREDCRVSTDYDSCGVLDYDFCGVVLDYDFCGVALGYDFCGVVLDYDCVWVFCEHDRGCPPFWVFSEDCEQGFYDV